MQEHKTSALKLVGRVVFVLAIAVVILGFLATVVASDAADRAEGIATLACGIGSMLFAGLMVGVGTILERVWEIERILGKTPTS